MEEAFLEAMLHIPCTAKPYDEAGRLPLYLKGGYDFKKVEVAKTAFLAAEPKEQLAFSVLKKHRTGLEELTGLKCAFILPQPTTYTKKKLIETGIPFVQPGREVYLPFLGVALMAERENPPAEIDRISFLTQKLLLTVLYQRIRRGTAAELAAKLEISRMSGVRCLDEIEVLCPVLIHKERRGRILEWTGAWRDYWATIRPILRSPIIKEYRLERPQNFLLPLGGMSAISCCTMLSDNAYPTYAATRTMASKLKLAELRQVPRSEMPAAVVQVVGYEINTNDAAIDPLSAVLSLDGEALEDPRVEGAIQQIEKEYIDNERD